MVLKRGRPKGTKRGITKRYSIGITDTNIAWLRSKKLSYSKIVNRLIKTEIEKGK